MEITIITQTQRINNWPYDIIKDKIMLMNLLCEVWNETHTVGQQGLECAHCNQPMAMFQ